MEFRNIGDYITTRAAQLRTSVRGLSIDLGWSESYLDGIARGTFSMSAERARKLGRHIYMQIYEGQAQATSVEEYIAVSLAAGLPWPPPAALPTEALGAAVAGLDAFNLAELINYAGYLRTRPAPAGLIDSAAEALGAAAQPEQGAGLPDSVLTLAERIAALPAELQMKTVSQLGDTVSLVEQLAGVTAREKD